MTKSVDEMTSEERSRFLARGHWHSAVFRMYRALTKAKQMVAEKDKRTLQLEAAGHADQVLSALWCVSNLSGEKRVTIGKGVTATLWGIEEDAINACKKRYELNGIDEFHDNGRRVFRTLTVSQPPQSQAQESDPYETF